MIDTADWFESDDALVAALRRADGRPTAPVEVPGYEDVLALVSGGQGIVYTAVDASSGRRVAIKMLRDDRFASELDRRRFEREIDLASALEHRNIVRVEASGLTGDGRRYLVMEYVSGTPLDEAVLESERADVRRTLGLFTRICDAVAYAHQRGVIHRDLKPSNIRIDPDGEPRVLDFGMAVAFGALARDRAHEPTTTLSGQFVGSLAWASPEQADGRPGAIDVRSDIYSLGVILYRLLAGVMPYEVNGPLREALDNIATEEPAPLRPVVPVDEDVEAIVRRCLAKDPDLRYQSAGDLARDLRRYLAGEPIEARRESAWRRLERTTRTYRRTALTAMAGLAVFVALTVVMTSLYRKSVLAEELAAERLQDSRRQTEYASHSLEFLREVLATANPMAAGQADSTVRPMLDRAADRIQRELAGQPEAEITISVTIGIAYLNLGAFDAAEPLLRRAIEMSRTQLNMAPQGSTRHAQLTRHLAEGLNAMGLVCQENDRFDEAEAMLDEAMRLQHGLGPRRPTRDAIHANINLAVLHAARGDVPRAETMILTAIDEASLLPGRTNPTLGEAELRLAQIRQLLGDEDAAERLVKQARARLSDHYGADGLWVASCLQVFADLRKQQERTAEGIDLANQALAIYRARVGPDHPRAADCLLIIADCHLQDGRLDAALDAVNEAIGIYRAAGGDRHSGTARGLERRALIHRLAERFVEAESDYRQSLDIYVALLPPGHADTSVVRGQLGCCLIFAGRYEEGAALVRAAVANLTKHFGTNSRQVADAARCLQP